MKVKRHVHPWWGDRGRASAGKETVHGGGHGREHRWGKENGDFILTWPDVLAKGPSRGIPHGLPFLPQGVWKRPLSVLALDNEVEATIKSATERPERSKA